MPKIRIRLKSRPNGNFSKIKEYLGNEEDVINFIEDSEILVTDLAPVSESILDKVKNLKYIGVSRGGPVNIDIDACKKNQLLLQMLLEEMPLL